jgi:hypothetical protein
VRWFLLAGFRYGLNLRLAPLPVPVQPGDDTRAAWYLIQTAIWVLEATIDMAEEDVATWLPRMKRLEQAHWGDSLQSEGLGERPSP